MKRRPLCRAGLIAPGLAVWLVLLNVPSAPVCAQQTSVTTSPLSAEHFDQQSLALRTALFHDPSLEAPLKSLAALYEQAGRREELIGLYSQHLAQYPEDAGARAVLIRLLQEWNRPEAISAAQAAVEAQPEHPLLNYLRYLGLAAQHDPRALDFLVRAAELETEPHRKKIWTEQLAEAAEKAGRREIAEKPLRALITATGNSAERLAALARTLHRGGYFPLALEAAEAGLARSPAPELGVELTLQAAAAEANLDQKAAAGARLDALLKRVAADYARRGEIVSRRVALMESNEERAAKLAEARAAWAAAPTSETAALELAEWLIACELRREALRVLREASQTLPQSAPIEQAVLDLLDRLADERGIAEYLQERLAVQPNREDLLWRRVRALYALGAKEEAAEGFEALLSRLDDVAQLARRLDLARALMRLNLPAEAAAEYAKVLAADSKRLDVRRELAEARLAAGDRVGADQLLRDALAPDAEIENFLDIIGLMKSRQQWAEARTALEARRAAQPKQFEVAMLLLEALTQLGDVAAGETLRDEIRPLADTDARFRRWLDGARALAEAAGDEAAFFTAEQQRLVEEAKREPDGWSATRAARYLTVCELAQAGPAEPALIEALKARLEDAAVPVELRVPLRRLLAEALRRDPKQVVEAWQQWQFLIEEDQAQADTYRLQLARSLQDELAARGGDPATVKGLLEKTEVRRIDDTVLLVGAPQLFLNYSLSDSALAAFKRLTELEPAELGHWEKWLGALAGIGDEAQFREGVGRVLAGATQAELPAEVVARLRGHLADSCWRSVVGIISDSANHVSRFAEALPLLEIIERTQAPGEPPHWLAWARAWVLRQLGHPEAAAEAAAQLEAVASRQLAESGQPQPLHFPDGLAMSLESALALLRDNSPAVGARAETPQGPDRSPQMRWGFHTPGGASVVQVIAPMEGKNVLVLDERGGLHSLDGATGKLLWQADSLWLPRSGPLPRVRGRAGARLSGAAMTDGQLPVSVPPRLAWTRDGSRLFLSYDGRVTARSGFNGEIVWENSLEGTTHRAGALPGQPTPAPLPDEVFLDQDGRLIIWRPEVALAAALNPETGKLLWSRSLAREKPPAIGPLSAGAACEGNWLLVYGQVPAVLDTASGSVRWRFASAPLREFPLSLSVEGSSLPSAAALTGVGSNAPRRLSMNYLLPMAQRAQALGSWMGNQGVLVAPPVAWAEQEDMALGGQIVGGRLLLSMPYLTMAPSLTLPIGGARFNLSGMFLGAAAQRAVLIEGEYLRVLDLSKGDLTHTINLSSLFTSVDSIGKLPPGPLPWEGVVAGPRVFVSSAAGLICVNPLNAQVLYVSPWPEKIRQWAGWERSPASVVPNAPPEQTQFLPRFVVRTRQGEAKAIFPRGAARGEMLWMVLADHHVVALAAPPLTSEIRLNR